MARPAIPALARMGARLRLKAPRIIMNATEKTTTPLMCWSTLVRVAARCRLRSPTISSRRVFAEPSRLFSSAIDCGRLAWVTCLITLAMKRLTSQRSTNATMMMSRTLAIVSMTAPPSTAKPRFSVMRHSSEHALNPVSQGGSPVAASSSTFFLLRLGSRLALSRARRLRTAAGGRSTRRYSLASEDPREPGCNFLRFRSNLTGPMAWRYDTVIGPRHRSALDSDEPAPSAHTALFSRNATSLGSALVLNQSYEPLCVVPVKRAAVLLLTRKAETVAPGDGFLRSETMNIPIPAVVRLNRYVSIPRQ